MNWWIVRLDWNSSFFLFDFDLWRKILLECFSFRSRISVAAHLIMTVFCLKSKVRGESYCYIEMIIFRKKKTAPSSERRYLQYKVRDKLFPIRHNGSLNMNWLLHFERRRYRLIESTILYWVVEDSEYIYLYKHLSDCFIMFEVIWTFFNVEYFFPLWKSCFKSVLKCWLLL